nr:hypothetical protein [Tanacetum cinerariifolium]
MEESGVARLGGKSGYKVNSMRFKREEEVLFCFGGFTNDDDSLYKENIEYVEASPHDSELVSLEAAEIVIPEVEEIEDDNLREKLLNVHLLIPNIEALKDNPTSSSKSLTKSSSTSPKSFLEETNTFHNSLPEFENFCFDLEEIRFKIRQSVTPTDTPIIRQYTRRTRIAQSSVRLPIADEPASPLRDVSKEEACPIDSAFIADQDRVTIAKSSILPYDSAPRVTSLTAIEGREAATERVSDDIEEMAIFLTLMDAATVLTSGVVDVPTGSGSIPTTSTPAKGSVPTASEEVPTASPVFATATVVTPVTRRKGKEVMVEFETPKKLKVQEQIDAQVARELEEQLAREDQRRAEQIARDAEIARIHAEEELQIMISGLDRNNETIAKYLEEYQQFSSKLPMERRIELISDLGMTFEEIEAKFNSVWKQMEDFIPIGSKEEAERIKRKEVPKEKVKEMMQLVPIEEVYVEALQVKHPIIDWKNTPALFLQLVDEWLLLPPKQTPAKVEKQSCTSLLMDLLAQNGYTDEKDDIINIVSLRKYSSHDTHINPLKLMKSKR